MPPPVSAVLVAPAVGLLLVGGAGLSAQEPESPSRLSDRPIPLRVGEVPDRVGPLLELGDPFLGTGPIRGGFELPTGAHFNPRLQVYGTFRSAVQGFYDGRRFTSEWANRLDLFANLQLSGTERLLLGLRPLDDEGREFSGYRFSPDNTRGWIDAFDARVSTLFFEGDFGELLPGLDPEDRAALDYGFAVGRQPQRVQEGMLLNDTVDAVGIVRNDLNWLGASNWRITALFAWGDIERPGGVVDDDAELLGLLQEADFGTSTLALDVLHMFAHDDTGDGLFVGASAVQRLAGFNTSFRVNTSIPYGDETASLGRGTLLFAETSFTPAGTEDLVYANVYWGIDEFSSAARSPDAGGPLGRVGILYAAQGLGRFASALDDDPQRSVGLALGWQLISSHHRRQLIVELGGRSDTDASDSAAAGLAFRYQQALGRRLIVQLDLHGSLQETRDPGFGTRLELRVKF